MRTSNGGFTLVEILIVVVILGILAAIVIPQFTQASTEARESSLVSNLQTIRSQIELYKIQHNDNPPTDATTFEAQMTGLTDVDGNAAAARSRRLRALSEDSVTPSRLATITWRGPLATAGATRTMAMAAIRSLPMTVDCPDGTARDLRGGYDTIQIWLKGDDYEADQPGLRGWSASFEG